MADLNDLKTILDSEAGEIAKKLDADDGSYDGRVDVEILNQFLTENGFQKYNSSDGKNWVSYIDVVKMIYNLKRELLASGDAKIKVDFDPVEELRKARKQYERWR